MLSDWLTSESYTLVRHASDQLEFEREDHGKAQPGYKVTFTMTEAPEGVRVISDCWSIPSARSQAQAERYNYIQIRLERIKARIEGRASEGAPAPQDTSSTWHR